MFLICNLNLYYAVNDTLCFIEENSVLVGIISSVIVSSFWFRNFIRQKRAEAFFGFYTKLSLHLSSLRTKLEDRGQINISDVKAGNIFALIYTDELRQKICSKYKVPDEKELKLYQSSAKDLKNILLDSDSNVYPKGSNRKKWYESQQILFDFCEFLENDTFQRRTNKDFGENEIEPKHIIKCRLLINAMDNIQKSINKVRY